MNMKIVLSYLVLLMSIFGLKGMGKARSAPGYSTQSSWGPRTRVYDKTGNFLYERDQQRASRFVSTQKEKTTILACFKAEKPRT